ncbi:MAG: helix-turn-helix transcriptional regulator [Gammaproteobacteria bacterium]|nr:helix-turn-helix transcriptional regulator [Gammaproteobacteria bacterium]
MKLGRIALECDSQLELQQAILRRLERALGAHSSLYFAITREHSRWSFQNGLSRGVPDQGPKLWHQRYHKQDPFVNAFLDAPDEDSPVVVSSQLMSHKKLIATEFYADFLKPQSVYHVLVLGLISHHQPIGLFGFHRPPGAVPFSRRDAEKACLLSPFLSAAVEKATRTEESSCYRSVIDTMVHDSSNRGVIVLNRMDTPLYANNKAEQLLRLPDEPPCDDLASSQSIPQHVLDFCRQIGHQNMGNSNGPDKLCLQATTDLSVEVHTCKDGTRVIYLNAGEFSNIRQDRLQEFCLTTRQRAIVHLVSTGMTNPEIAQKLFISIRTVQNHLRSIYAKVDVHNRTSLVNRLSH